MYDFGDELGIESYRIPWLIWIQVLVLFLLFFLLYCFSLFTSDLSEIPATSSSSPSPSHDTSCFDIKPVLKVCNASAVTANRLQHRQVAENQILNEEIAPSTGRRIVAENNVEGQSSHISFHPATILGWPSLPFSSVWD